MDELDIAVHQTAKEFGFQALAEKMGKREQTLRNKCNPADDSAVLTLREAVALVLNTSDTRIAHAFARICGGEFREASHTPREAAEVTREINEAIDALQQLQRSVQAAAEQRLRVAS